MYCIYRAIFLLIHFHTKPPAMCKTAIALLVPIKNKLTMYNWIFPPNSISLQGYISSHIFSFIRQFCLFTCPISKAGFRLIPTSITISVLMFCDVKETIILMKHTREKKSISWPAMLVWLEVLRVELHARLHTLWSPVRQSISTSEQQAPKVK